MQIGEITPAYSYWRPAMKRIRKYNPRMKLILLLRNPVDRAYSHWAMEYFRGAETLPFDLAIEKEIERGCFKLPDQAQHLVYSYLDRGNYPTQIERIWHFFRTDQVLILNSDNFRASPEKTYAKVCEFLGIRTVALPKIDGSQRHMRKYGEPISDTMRERLYSLFKCIIRDTERLLGWHTGWLK